MIQTTHTCRKCGSSDIVKNGHSASGSQQYHCKSCGAYLVLDPGLLEVRTRTNIRKKKKSEFFRPTESAGPKARSAAFSESVEILSLAGSKKGRRADSLSEQVEPPEEGDVLELDECWTYVRQRSNKRWLWIALCRRTRQVVAFVIGDRSAKTCARLWAKIPSEYREKQSFSDFWKSYRPVFEEDPKSDSSNHEQVGKGSGELSHVERFFGLIRQRLSRYARETRSASQTERMLHLRTKLFVDTYNRAVT